MNDLDQCLAAIIESHSGLQINGTHCACVRSYAQRRMQELQYSQEQYCQFVLEAPEELSLLIDEAAINETYFFREERQFEYLRDHVFPQYQGKRVVIWSACCSTGEEAVSLAVLAKYCGLEVELYASDIDVSAISVLRKGIYPRESFRPDGMNFHPLLNQYGSRNEKTYTIAPEILSTFHISEHNLAGTSEGPVGEAEADIVFVRNVFIYFNKDMRSRILSRIARCLKPGGFLFFSMNEIAGISSAGAGVPLVKEHCGSVYFFRRITSEYLADEKKAVAVVSEHKTRSVKPHRPAVTVSKLHEEHAAEIKISVLQQGPHIMEALNRRNIKDARRLLDSCMRSPADLEYLFYYDALVSKEEGKRVQALNLFLRASLLNHDFWPAFLQLGLLHEEQGNEKDAVKAFSACAKILEKYIERQESCYNFLVESFSPSYFYTLCSIYIKKGKNHVV